MDSLLSMMFPTVRVKYKAWVDDRFLKKNLCTTWKQYHRKNDPDISYRASRVKDYYHGYQYVHGFESGKHYAYTLRYDYGPGGHRYGFDDIVDWCEENCEDKVRHDFFRVFRYDADCEWEINEIGGSDIVFVAFKNQEDYMYFKLRWA